MKRPDNSSRKNSRGGAGKSERTGNRKRTGSDDKASGGFRGRKDDRPSFDKPKRDNSSGSAAPRGRRSNFNNFDSPRNIERGESKPKPSSWDDFDAPTERSSDRPFSRDRKPFGDSSDRPKRPYNREEKSDRPFSRDRKPFGDNEKPKRPYNREEKSDRPYSRDKKPFGDDATDKPKRSYKREEGEERPARKTEERTESSDRSKRAYKGGKEEFRSTKSQRGTFTENGPIRLNRYISMAGICSRREADEMILAGVVSVNGEVITELGTKVAAGDDIRYNGERLRNEELKYVLLNKPKDYITTMEDPTARKTVMELISGACRERVYPVGRLDRNTTGLLLFTNDGDLAKVLTHPSSMVRKIYHVELDKSVKAGDLKQIVEGVELEDGMMRADEVTYDGDGSDKKSVGLQIHSGKNRIVRRIFEHLGYEVMKLDRVMFAGLTKKDLPRGRWRVLNENEIGMLKMISSKPMKGQRQ